MASATPCTCRSTSPARRLVFLLALVTIVLGLVMARAFGATAAETGAAGAGLMSPACSPLPVVARHRYRMAGKIRPLLFWIGRDNVGEAQIVWRRESAEAYGFELLIGSDPKRAPRRINRWGYIAEQVDGSNTCIVGVMKQSNEKSIAEAKSHVESEAKAGGHVYKAIRSTVTPDEARARVTRVQVGRDLTFRDLDALLASVAAAPPTGEPKTIPLPPGTRPGFLVTLSDLVHADVQAYQDGGPLKHSHAVGAVYVYNDDFYDLTLRRSEFLRESHVGKRTVANLVRGEFRIHNRTTHENSDFEMVYGTEGSIAEVPVRASYRPRWWLEVDLTLDDGGEAPSRTDDGAAFRPER